MKREKATSANGKEAKAGAEALDIAAQVAAHVADHLAADLGNIKRTEITGAEETGADNLNRCKFSGDQLCSLSILPHANYISLNKLKNLFH